MVSVRRLIPPASFQSLWRSFQVHQLELVSLSLLWVFHSSVSWWSFTEIWVTAKLLKCPGLFSVSRPIVTIDGLDSSADFPFFQSPPAIFRSLWGPFQVHQIGLVSPSLLCCTVIGFFFSFQARSKYLPIFFFDFHFVVCRNSKIHQTAISFCCFCLLIIIKSGFLAEIRWSVCISNSENFACLILKNGFCFVYISIK